MSVRWWVFGECIIGDVVAPNHRAAQAAAARAYGARVGRIQSQVSAQVAQLELTPLVAREVYGATGPVSLLVPCPPRPARRPWQ